MTKCTLSVSLSSDWHWFVVGKQSGDFWEVGELIHDSGWWVSAIHSSYHSNTSNTSLFEMIIAFHLLNNLHLMDCSHLKITMTAAAGRFSIKPQGGTLPIFCSACVSVSASTWRPVNKVQMYCSGYVNVKIINLTWGHVIFQSGYSINQNNPSNNLLCL